MEDSVRAGPMGEDPLIGTRLGGYVIETLVGKGAMGAVYRAVQVSLNRHVALKVMAGHLVGSEESAVRFWREARAAAAINHPNLVQVHDFGEDNGIYFYVMELVDGLSLGAYLRRGDRFTERECIEVGREVTLALRAAHRAGVIHRDLKPDNLMLNSEGVVKVADLGVARFLAEGGEEPDGGVDAAGGARDLRAWDSLTLTGVGVGTPAFMSPEQIRAGSSVDHRSDFYALGATLFQLATCRVPFPAETAAEVLEKQISAPVPRARDVSPALGSPFSDLIRRLMAKTPEERPQTHEEILTALEGCLRAVRTERGGASRVRMADEPTWAERLASHWPTLIGTAALVAAAGLVLGREPRGSGSSDEVSRLPLVESAPWDAKDAEGSRTLVGKDANAFPSQLGISKLRHATPPAAGADQGLTGSAASAVSPSPETLASSRPSSEKAGPAATIEAVPDGLSEGLVLYFPFDRAEPDGLVLDRSGRGNHGKATGSRWTSEGRIGGGFEFGPSMHYIRVPDHPTLNNGNLTVAAWIKTAHRDPVWRRIVDKGWTHGYAVSIAGDVPDFGRPSLYRGKLCLEVNNSKAVNYGHASKADQDLCDGRWHHIVAIYDGSEQRLYVDGRPEGRIVRWNGAVAANSRDVIVGMNLFDPDPALGEPGHSFDGSMDELRIYSRALSHAHITDLFQLANGPRSSLAGEPKGDVGGAYTNAIGMEMVYIHPGEFLMGSTHEERAWAEARGARPVTLANEKGEPVRTKVARGFWLGRTPVTVAQWRQFQGATGYATEAEKRGFAETFDLLSDRWRRTSGANWRDPKYSFPPDGGHPVACVTWSDALAFCDWLTAHEKRLGQLPEGLVYRLPCESEWEYACRAGGQTKFWWGDDPREGDGRVNWMGKADGFESISPVDHFGSHGRNGFGLADIIGNVWEWCLDAGDVGGAHAEVYVGHAVERVVRGGSFFDNPGDHRCASRGIARADYAASGFGFRLCRGEHLPRPGSPTLTHAVAEGGTTGAKSSRLSPPAMAGPTTGGMGTSNSATVGEGLKGARKEQPLINSLGMRFVAISGTNLLFSIWETRVRDFGAFVRATGHDAGDRMYVLQADGWKERQGYNWRKAGFQQGDDHPVVGVSWEDAGAFCRWLTDKERREARIGSGDRYRLPTDHEWSCAVGIGEREDPRAAPKDKDGQTPGVYPWGPGWPPPQGAGNYAGQESRFGQVPSLWRMIDGYRDGFPRTAPVGSFSPNSKGLYDMGGNAWEWCEDAFEGGREDRVLRGGAWCDGNESGLLSSRRFGYPPEVRRDVRGFRCALIFGEGSVSSNDLAP